MGKNASKVAFFMLSLWGFAPVAQLDRVADFESVGCRFDPCQAQ